MGMFRAGSQLGTGIAGALGYEDPEIAQARARQGMLSGVDMNNPESLLAVAQQAQQAGDFQTAQALVTQANEVQAKQTSTRKTLTEMETEQNRIRYAAQFVKSRLPNLTDAQAEALATDKEAVNKLLDTPKINTQVVETAQGQLLINKDNGQLIANIGPAPDRRQSTTNVFKTPADTVGLMKSYEDLTKTERETLQTVTQAKSLINEAATANNSVAWESARTQIAKAVGEGRLSNEDIRRTGTDPRLVQGTLDWINKKIEGVPNQDIQRQLFAVAALLERNAVDKINQSSERVRASARAAGVADTEMETMFPKINVDRSPRRTNAGSTQTSRGTKYQIIEE
jgi:organic hydroperoxide reductase OsmC/OhrA